MWQRMPKQALPPLKIRLLVSAIGIAVFTAAWAARPLLQQRGALLFEAKSVGLSTLATVLV